MPLNKKMSVTAKKAEARRLKRKLAKLAKAGTGLLGNTARKISERKKRLDNI